MLLPSAHHTTARVSSYRTALLPAPRFFFRRIEA